MGQSGGRGPRGEHDKSLYVPSTGRNRGSQGSGLQIGKSEYPVGSGAWGLPLVAWHLPWGDEGRWRGPGA